MPLFRGHLVEGAVAGDAGVVDEDVDRADRRCHRGDHRLAARIVGHVAGNKRDVEALVLELRLPGFGLGFVAIVGGDPVAEAGEAFDDGGADASGAAGDECGACVHGVLLSVA